MFSINPFCVAIVDDHTLFRKTFKHFIQTVCSINVCMEAVDGSDLLNQLQSCIKLPGIIISDIMMPVMDGRELIQNVKKLYPGIKVIALSSLHHEDTVIEMFRYGANGFITKNIEPEGLIKAIQSVIQNQYFLFDGTNESIFYTYQQKLKDKPETVLTEKQINFMQLCASDLTYKAIADKLEISPRTVDSYRDQLFEKLNVKSRTAMVLYAVQNGYITL
jgi:DNA-binding NarL/FixJ family response regulator